MDDIGMEDLDPVDAMAAEFEAQMDAADQASYNEGGFRSPGDGGIQSDEAIFEPKRDSGGRFVSIDETTQGLHAVEAPPEAPAAAQPDPPEWEQQGQRRVDTMLSSEIQTLHERLRQAEDREQRTQQWINQTFPTEQTYQTYQQQAPQAYQQQAHQQQPPQPPQAYQPQAYQQQAYQQQPPQPYQPQPDPYMDPDIMDAQQRVLWQQNQQMQQHLQQQQHAQQQHAQQLETVQQHINEQEDRYWLAQVEQEAQQATSRYTSARPQSVLAMFAACKGSKSIAQCAREDHEFIQSEINSAISARASQGAPPTQVRGRETLESARSELIPNGLIKGDFGDFERVAQFTRKQFGVRR
tara:strand:- start:2501 stop:3559 length:1059 start_codon:yes stop_codon:yes gene_type:complete